MARRSARLSTTTRDSNQGALVGADPKTYQNGGDATVDCVSTFLSYWQVGGKMGDGGFT